MRINEIADIAHASLLTQPDVSLFANITTHLDRVERGSLFIATKMADAKEAIGLGAYGILFEDGDLDILDPECAWLKVDSLQDAIIRLVRYKLLANNISILYCKEIEFEIAQEIAMDSSLEFLYGGYADFLESVQKPEIRKIITSNSTLLEIPLEYTQSIIPQTKPFKIISCTLFDSKIYFDSKRYTLCLPSIFLDDLASVITLFENENICFSLSNFESISYLKPIFITSKNVLCPFGQSGRVLIAEKQIELFQYYAHYITENAKWAKILFFAPQGQTIPFAPLLHYSSQEELLELIQKHSFNFGMILGIQNSFLLNHLPSNEEEKSLFDV